MNGTYTARSLLAAMRWIKANPTGLIDTGIWPNSQMTVTQYRAWFVQCLHAKINRLDTRVYRALSDDYQRDLARDARTINEYYGSRVRHSGSRGLLRTKEMRARYPHVNCQAWED